MDRLDEYSNAATMEYGSEKGKKSPPYVISFICELLGTAILLFVGCMGCILNYNLGPLLPSFSFGFAVMIPVQIFCNTNPVHLNPAVSLAMLIFGEMEWRRFLVYIVAQYAGSFLGYGLLKLTTPSSSRMCLLSLKNVTVAQGFFLEYFCTLILVIFVFGATAVSDRDSFCLRVGLMIAGLVFAVESFTGAGLNPARSMPPVVFENIWTDHWLYQLAPYLGMATGSVFYRFVLKANEKYSLYRWLANR